SRGGQGEGLGCKESLEPAIRSWPHRLLRSGIAAEIRPCWTGPRSFRRHGPAPITCLFEFRKRPQETFTRFCEQRKNNHSQRGGQLSRSRQRGCKYRFGFGGNIPGFSAARRDASGG